MIDRAITTTIPHDDGIALLEMKGSNSLKPIIFLTK